MAVFMFNLYSFSGSVDPIIAPESAKYLPLINREVTLQRAIKIAESYLKELKIDLRSYFLQEAKFSIDKIMGLKTHWHLKWVKWEGDQSFNKPLEIGVSGEGRIIYLEGNLWSRSEKLPKYGEVKTLPYGCIYMAFIHPKDDTHCKRSQDGQIKFVVTPTERVERIVQRYSPIEFAEEVDRNSTNEWHCGAGIPDSAAWQYVERYLAPTDEVWTFLSLDKGFVVIRSNKIFCLVMTDHNR
jgi:hypothetical protein